MYRTGSLKYLLITLLFVANVVSAQEVPVLPYPRHVEAGNSSLYTLADTRIDLSALTQPMALRLAFHAKDLLRKGAKKKLEIILIDDATVLPHATKAWRSKIGNEGYLLIIEKERQLIAAKTETGLFYGLQSYKQLQRAGWNRALLLADWPELATRAIYDDISRGPVPTVAFVKEQIERMAELKINYLSFYIEHVVMPVNHPDFAPADGKFTIADIRELSAYAEKFHMQLIGSFQSFGHFEKILSLPQYASMGETSTLISPLDPKAKKFLQDVIGELCDAFNAPFFNVNCDETFGIADGKSKPYIDSIGIPKFYADHIKFLYDIVSSHKKQLMMWGDVALQHEEILDLLPKDIIYLTWEYGDQKNYDEWIKPFTKRRLRFMVCPGILNSYRMFPDMVMAKANIRGFIHAGAQAGTEGAFTTIWDDGGNYLFSGDWYGVYAAAEQSWNPGEQYIKDFDVRFSQTAFGTQTQYVHALFKLMELRNVPLTYNLNDQLWNQKILPEPGKRLIINNASAPLAKSIVTEAKALLANTSAKNHQADIDALRFAIDNYLLMVESRIVLAGIAVNDTIKNAGILPQLIALQSRYEQLERQFKNLWLRENQPHWLTTAATPYEEKMAAIRRVRQGLEQSAAPKKDIGFNITVNENFYFQNWMVAGPFPLAKTKNAPDFLYSERTAYNKPPSPGNFTHYLGKTYRWQKYASGEGGIIDLFEYYKKTTQSSAYAYCLINTADALSAEAFVSSITGLEIFCNGVRIPVTQFSGDESKLSLPLKSGANHLLIKIPETTANRALTFRLDPKIRITNHKHKYTLNPKNLAHEVE